MKRMEIHTVPNREGSGWVNMMEGEVVSRHIRKDTAMARGRTLARRDHAEHVIHNKDGRIGESNSYGHDPFPPKG